VIAGTAGGLRLATPPGLGTRPITDRTKESLFGSLGPEALDAAVVLDLYAGSGAMAIEALSRGAARAVLVERDPKAVEVVRKNLATTHFADDAEVVRGDVGAYLRGRPPPHPFTLVFCDPPYDVPTFDVESILATLARGWVASGTTVVIRRRTNDGAPALPPNWSFTRERTFGDTLLLVARIA
jgi:16S rRNA (guanine966-N2)-methyltransferase